jgi:hypothetical protein
VKRSTIAGLILAALAILAGAFALGYVVSHARVVTHTVTVTRITVSPGPTVTKTRTHTRVVYRTRHPKPAPSPTSAPVTVSFGCKILASGSSEEFNVNTVGGGSYSGSINVSFYGPTGSGQVFPGTTVQGATPVGTWRPVPSADIGASARPVGCVASAG